MSQIPLDLGHVASFEMADFIVSNSNEAAFSLVQGWPHWPGHAVALVGPSASGKTHLACAWASDVGAQFFYPGDDVSALRRNVPVVAEDMDRGAFSDDELFHLFNWTKEINASLLITARTPPTQWDVSLPDLRSRLATVAVGEIYEPDDDLLMVLLVKLFSDRQLQVDMAVMNYVLPRIERSFAAVYRFVKKLDEVALAHHKKITRTLAKECLEGPET